MKTALIAVVVLAGCAGISTADCGSDWYGIGQRDGRLGASSQIEGWDAGWAMRPRVPSF